MQPLFFRRDSRYDAAMLDWCRQQRQNLTAIGVFLAVFIVFFWPATFGGRFFVSNDALIYSYPLRTLAWQMIRNGELPLWTPHILSGYPLLSMAQLALAYPLTWGYLFLSGHAAEQIYILGQYLLAPTFLFLYLRQLGCSWLAGILAGLSFTYGGLMLSPLGEAGMYTNAVLWLPLFLLALEHAREQSFARSLCFATGAYLLSVLTGIGQGFLYVGIIGLTYALMLSLFAPGAQKRWRPVIVAVAAVAFSGAFVAWQILETLAAQRLSIRRTLDYATFSGDAFSLTMLWRLLTNPLPHFINQYNLFAYECTPFIALLPLLCATVAAFQLIHQTFFPTKPHEDFTKAEQGASWGKHNTPRIAFWLIVALLGLLFMLGNATPLYRVLYAIPIVNLFRNAWRHAFEWTFAVSVLAAFGFDWLASRWTNTITANTKQKLIGAFLLLLTLATTGWLGYRMTQPGARSRSVVALIEAAPVIWPDGLSPNAWLAAKLTLALLAFITLWWSLRSLDGWWRNVVGALALSCACLLEPYLIASHWWFPQAQPATTFTSTAAATKWLQQHNPTEQRIFTTMTAGFQLDLRRADPHDLSARRGLHDAAGYEPLMPARYADVFGRGWHFTTPDLATPRDPKVVKPEFRGFDLLNVRFVEWFAATLPSSIERGTDENKTRFAALDGGLVVMPNQTQTLYAHAEPVNTLSLVTTLANSAGRKTGEPFARVVVNFNDDRTLERTLKVGEDSAEYAYDRPDVIAKIQHARAPLFDTLPGGDRLPANRYWTRIPFDTTTAVNSVSLENLTSDVTIYMSRASLYDKAKAEVLLLTPRLPDWRKVYDFDHAQIYENPRVLPRVWLTDQVRQVTPDEALRAIRGETPFEPRSETLIERPAPQLTQRFAQPPQARITAYTANHLTIETNADAPAMLNISERYAPGWTATVDGQPTRIYQADYLLRAVTLPAGQHRVEMRYSAPAAQRGGLISIVAGLLFAGSIVISHKRDW